MASIFALDVTDRDEARRATRNAAIAGVVSAGVTVLLILLTQSAEAGPLSEFLDGWALIDVGILLVMAYGTYRVHRYAAVGLAMYYILNQVLLRVQTGSVSGIAVALLFTVLFVQGARGAWAVYRMDRDAELEAQVSAIHPHTEES